MSTIEPQYDSCYESVLLVGRCMAVDREFACILFMCILHYMCICSIYKIYRLPPLPPTSGPEAWMPGCLDAWVLGCLAAGVPVACQMTHLAPPCRRNGCLDAWVLGCLDAGVPVACQMSHLALPCWRERQFGGQGAVGGHKVCQTEIPCGVLLGPAVTPLR